MIIDCVWKERKRERGRGGREKKQEREREEESRTEQRVLGKSLRIAEDS